MLIDTSVWLEFLAPRTRVLGADELDEIADAITEGEVCITLPIYAELLSGSKHGDRELATLLSSLRFVDLDWSAREPWDRVAALGQHAFARRQRIPGLVDRMILAAAEASGEILWALDGPLMRLARSLGIATRKHS